MTIRESTEQWEDQFLSPYAAHSRDSRGREVEETPCDIRPVYQRDRDRILHCKAFRRLKHKTQVFLTPQGDHYRTRLTHTLEVAQTARTIARALRLNEDLTEAIALGHDLGHTPFGHAGERALNEVFSEVHGDLGVSMIDGRNVSDEVTKALGKSAVLAVTSLAAGVAAALPLGVMSAARKEKMFDRITGFFVFIRLCMPSFLVGIGFLYLFAYCLKLISISGSGGVSALILPAATLATGICARMIRQIRTLIYEEMKHPYVDGLRSRGIRETQILFVHILRNAMLPIITMIALSFGELLGGTAITEIIFSWPGIGRLVMTAIGEHYYTIIQGFVVMIALLFFVIYGLTELSYSLFDPRVKKQKEDSQNG